MMKHALLILCHKEFHQAVELLRLFDEDFVPYIHFDKKMELPQEYEAIIRTVSPLARTYSEYNVKWGGLSIVKAQLMLMKAAVEDGGYGYLHLLSSQDMPIRSIAYIKKRFEEEKGKEFINFFQLPSQVWDDSTFSRLTEFHFYDFFDYNTAAGLRWIDRVERIKKRFNPQRTVPAHFKRLYGGSNWISITSACASYICEYHRKHRSFYRRLRFTLAPDEIYFNTIVLNSPFAKNTVNNNLRFYVWNHGAASPKNLSVKHFFDICTCDAIFARKLEPGISDDLVSCIKKYIFNDSPISIGKTGCWENSYLSGHVFDKGLAEGICKILNGTKIESIGDFGCGPGWYVAYLRRHGFDAEGYDGNPLVEEISSRFFGSGFYCQRVDLTEELKAEPPFDMVISLEVGEHIPEKYEDVFIQNLTRNSSKYILLSWAVENQAGDGHINCRANEYVISKLRQYGYIHVEAVSAYLRRKCIHWWFKYSLMFFQSIS